MSPTKQFALIERVWDCWEGIWYRMFRWASRLLPVLTNYRLMTAKKYRQLGIDAYMGKDIPAAIKYMTKAIEYAPSDPGFYSDLGQIYYEIGQLANAEKQFRQALTYDYSNLRALRGLAYTLHVRGSLSEAVFMYLRYLELNEKDADVLLNLGAALQASGDYASALRYYSMAEKLDSKNAAIPANRARVLYSMGKIEESIGSMRQALRLAPDNSELHRLLADSLAVNGDVDQALRSYQRAIELDSKNASARVSLSRLLSKAGNYQEAAEQASFALKIFEEVGDTNALAEAFWGLGWYYYQLGQWADSVQASRNALKVNPKLFGARFNLGLALLHDGRWKDARKEYEIGAYDVSSASDLRFWAMEDLEKALEKIPDLPGGAEILGMLRGRYEALQETRSDQPQSVEAESLGGKATAELQTVDSTGFFTLEGIRQLITDSGLVQPDEQLKRVLLLFSTSRQHTWLVATSRQLFCVLDDEKTRASRRLIQWRMDLDEARNIGARPYKPSVGLVNVGPRKNWLYSQRLHPDPSRLETEIRSMVSAGG